MGGVEMSIDFQAFAAKVKACNTEDEKRALAKSLTQAEKDEMQRYLNEVVSPVVKQFGDYLVEALNTISEYWNVIWDSLAPETQAMIRAGIPTTPYLNRDVL
jgi:thermostable 8-oxoguanine DNA glycosylase